MNPPAPDSFCATAQAQPNIALIKYWGKRDVELNLPAVGSISLTLDQLWTRTKVCFVRVAGADRVRINGRTDAVSAQRVSACLDLLRQRAGVDWRAEVTSESNFPLAAGLASSASGFAALVRAAAAALELPLSPAELSRLARRGSGSAARSIHGGFVEWDRGACADGSDSHARQLMPAADWPLRVLVAITTTAPKEVGSREGMLHSADTSPFYPAWLTAQSGDLEAARGALRTRDFEALAAVSEHSCLKMHALAMSARPGLLYWNGATVEGMRRVRALRTQGLPVFFTVDAGPQLKVVCEESALLEARAALLELEGVHEVIECGLGEGARLLETAFGGTS